MHYGNSLSNDKILDWSKLKAFADDKIDVGEKLKLDLWRVENVRKGENAGNQHFLLFQQYSLPLSWKNFANLVTFKLFANALNLEQPNILSFG